jgi:hypothetical protein
MALYPKLLAATTITGTTLAPLYNGTGGSTVPLRSTFVKSILLTNASAGSVTLNLYVCPANASDAMTTKYRIMPKDVTIPAGNQLVVDNELTLSRQNFATPPALDIHGDIIAIQLAASSSLDVVTTGIESDM